MTAVDEDAQCLPAIGVAWWNTSLSPNADADRASNSDRINAAAAIDELVKMGSSVIGLCEVSQMDMDYLCVHSALRNFACTDPGAAASARSRFDTCIAYDPDLFTLGAEADLVAAYGAGHFRVAQRFELQASAGGRSLHVFVSHWPSRLNMDANDTKRILYAAALRDAVNALLTDDPAAQIILMGDYNEEPFSESMCVGLRASRDRPRSESKPDLLYNPFWRHLSSYRRDPKHSCSDEGTYYYHSGDTTRWHTFDQMLFSYGLLTGAGGLALDEHSTRAHVASWLEKLLLDRKSLFDHRPIVGRLLRV